MSEEITPDVPCIIVPLVISHERALEGDLTEELIFAKARNCAITMIDKLNDWGYKCLKS
jgi:hypothetical protein